jgi:DNA-binding MarR family transcriptional regulator
MGVHDSERRACGRQRRHWHDGPNDAAALGGGLGELGITACQFQFLSLIAATPKLNQTDLVEASGIDRSATPRRDCKELRGRGLITRVRDRRDARAYQLNLADQGRALLRKANPLADKAETVVLARFSDRERALMNELHAFNTPT